MPDLTPQALAWLQTHHGLTTRRLLAEHGVGRRTVSRLVAGNVLVQDARYRVVLRSPTVPVTFEQRCLAICLDHPSAVLTGPTGGRLMGLRRMPRLSAFTVAVPHGVHLPVALGVEFRQTTKLDARDRVVRADGIVVAAPARLAFDLAADLGHLDHLSVVEQLLHEHHCTVDELRSMVERLVHPRRAGSFRFLRALEARGDRPAAESHPELELAEALRALGIPIEVQTTWLDLPNGRRIRLDVSVPAVRWGLEIDAHPGHLGLSGSTRDKQRDRQCHMIGWQVDRVTPLELTDVPTLAEELLAVYEARVAEVSTR